MTDELMSHSNVCIIAITTLRLIKILLCIAPIYSSYFIATRFYMTNDYLVTILSARGRQFTSDTVVVIMCFKLPFMTNSRGGAQV